MSCVCAKPIDAARGSTPFAVARLEARDGDDLEPIVQADVDEIIFSVRDIDDPDPVTGVPRESAGGDLLAADVIFDTIQTGDIWEEDGIGYNFLHMLPATAIDHDEHSFVAEYSVKLQDESVQTWRYPINAKRRYTDF